MEKKMASNEVRKDYLLNRWVVIAQERKKRPTDFVVKETIENEGFCPLCLGNEHVTPPAVLVYLASDGKIRKEKDQNGFRHKNWQVRVIPNLYPAFAPPTGENWQSNDRPNLKKAVGHHEVIIESPDHSEHPEVARLSQLVHVINAYLDRLNELSGKPYVKHVAIFRNHGHEAGASLSHAHSQLIATPFIPTILEEEFEASRNFWTQNRECTLGKR